MQVVSDIRQDLELKLALPDMSMVFDSGLTFVPP